MEHGIFCPDCKFIEMKETLYWRDCKMCDPRMRLLFKVRMAALAGKRRTFIRDKVAICLSSDWLKLAMLHMTPRK